MVRPRVYLDTTVPSALLDARAPDRQRLTQEFWQQSLPKYEGAISTLVLAEIQATPDAQRRVDMLDLVHALPILEYDTEAANLASEYIRRGIFSERYDADASHVALAVTHGIPYLASWNFRHLVKVATRREVNLVNALLGYGPIEIVAPSEL